MKLEFGLASRNVLDIIKTGLDHISPSVYDELGKEQYNIYIIPGKLAQIFLVRHEDSRFISDIKDRSLILHSGIYFGYLQENEFYLGLEGGEFIITQMKPKSDLKLKEIMVNEQSAKSFLYGNSLRPDAFVRSPKILNRKDLIFVKDPQNRFIGIGYIFKKIKYLEDQTDRSEKTEIINKGSMIIERARNSDRDGKFKGKKSSRPRQDIIEEIELRNLVDYGYYIRRGY
jgi:ribosome biogenesis protein Nip4